MSQRAETREPASHLPALGDVIASKYRLESVLGRGGMGIVFAARHMLTQRRFALKWMDPELSADAGSRERFVREAQALGRIDHPAVVGVLDVGTEEDGLYLVMELVRGEPLRWMMKRQGRVRAETAVRLLLPALEGVEAAHRVGVIHRDLKPENLYVVRGDRAREASTCVLDFGVSKMIEPSREPARGPLLVRVGRPIGTPRYMAPEQVQNAEVDARTDVWALGAVLYEMIGGVAPFDGPNEPQLFAAIATEPLVPLRTHAPETPAAIASAVEKALAKRPADRFQSVAELGVVLATAVGATFHEPAEPSLLRLEMPVVAQPPTSPGHRRALAVDVIDLVDDDESFSQVPTLARPAPLDLEVDESAIRPSARRRTAVERRELSTTAGWGLLTRRLVVLLAIALLTFAVVASADALFGT